MREQKPYRKWTALLGLYKGARANKICQLYADDVQQLKTANSARPIPIHSSLIAGGFMDFVQERAGGPWFSHQRPVGEAFHSLRHTVATVFKDHGVPLQYVAAILGQTKGAISDQKSDQGYILDGFL